MYDRDLLVRLQAAVAAAVRRWGFGAQADVSLLTVSENATFRIREQARQAIVRVHRAGYHDRGEILSELAWINALRDAQIIDTPAPLPLADGGHLLDLGPRNRCRYCVAFEFVAGHEPAADESSPRWLRRLGGLTAALHRHSREWQRPGGFKRKIWDVSTTLGPEAHWGDWRTPLSDGTVFTRADRDILERAEMQLRATLLEYGTQNARFGLVHADLRLANLLTDGERLTVIDFDDCGFSWFAYDFAAAVSFLEESPLLAEWLSAWLEGYRAVKPLCDADARIIPALILLRRYMLTAWLVRHAETPTAAAAGADYRNGTVRLADRFLLGRL